MKDTNFIEILPYDEAEILDEEPSLPRSGLRVIGLSKSRNAVTLGLLDNGGQVMRTIERSPQRVLVRLVSCDPRMGIIYPNGKTMEETREYLRVIQAYMKKRAGDFDEWAAPGAKSEVVSDALSNSLLRG